MANLVFADDNGVIYNHPYLELVGASARENRLIHQKHLIDLPEFSKLFYLFKCPPIGYDPHKKKYITLKSFRIGKRLIKCHGVGAFMPPGFVRTFLPAADYKDKDYILPMWSYTALGFENGTYKVCGFQVEYNNTWDPINYDDDIILPQVERLRPLYPQNRLLKHLENCALNNHCFAAKNLFLNRWEAPLPISRSCNARCLGCISLQPEQGCEASHGRIEFTPTVEEIAQLAVSHLETAIAPIVSFGQGCEGEPLTEWALIRDSIKEIRSKTEKGTINLNTNGSMPVPLFQIIISGLDSIRVSMASVREDIYNAYHRPVNYVFKDVIESLKICRDNGLYTMINYLIFPGVTDQEEELESLFNLLQKTDIKFIHFKNLNIDPDFYLGIIKRGNSPSLGIERIVKEIKNNFSDVRIGYFNQPVKEQGI